MFDSTEQEIRDRIRQSKEILSLIERLEGGNSAKLEKEAGEVDIIKIQKGIFFVSLYSSIEYSLTASSACFLTLLNSLTLLENAERKTYGRKKPHSLILYFQMTY